MPRLDRGSFHWLAALSILPLLVWWLGWHPGFLSSDTVDQWRQGLTGNYFDAHPVIHTLYLRAFSLGNRVPGLVTLLQVASLVTLLVVATKRLIVAGTPKWLAVSAAWLVGLSPAVAPTTISLWKDVAFGLCVLWAWTELLALANDGNRWDQLWTPTRLGLALGGIWVFRGNGPITVLIVLVGLAWIHRRRIRRIAVPAAVTVAVAGVLTLPIAVLLEPEGQGIDPAQVFLADLAASYTSEPETFSPDEVTMVTALAPTEVWTERYDCYDSTPLVFDPRFDHRPIRQDPWAYRQLILTVMLRDPDSVLGHRACVANFLYSPVQPADTYFHRPPYEIPANDVGLARSPISDRAFALTDKILRWADGMIWLAWRPAIVLLPALGTLAMIAIRRRATHLLLPGSLFIAHLANVAITSPAQEFRYAYPLYLIGLLTLPLAVPGFVSREKNGHGPVSVRR